MVQCLPPPLEYQQQQQRGLQVHPLPRLITLMPLRQPLLPFSAAASRPRLQTW